MSEDPSWSEKADELKQAEPYLTWEQVAERLQYPGLPATLGALCCKHRRRKTSREALPTKAAPAPAPAPVTAAAGLAVGTRVEDLIQRLSPRPKLRAELDTMAADNRLATDQELRKRLGLDSTRWASLRREFQDAGRVRKLYGVIYWGAVPDLDALQQELDT